MKLSQATRKLALCTAQGFNTTTLAWELLPYKVSYPPDGRFIGRSVDFYNRRIFITPEAIPDNIALIKIGPDDSEVLMIYASQQNINRDETYLFSHTGLNIQGYAKVHRMVKTVTASGVGGIAVDTVVGEYPVAMEKGFSGPQNYQASGVYNTRLSCYIPAYADVKTSDTLEFQGESYVIDESVPELRMRFLQITKR